MTSQVFRSVRAYTTPTTINMTGLEIEPERVWDLLLFTRLAAELNGNKKDMWPVELITTNGEEIFDRLPWASKKYKPDFPGFHGMTFTYQSKCFIWVKARPEALRNVKKTVVHEIAHARAHSGTSHGWTWRSLYARFLPLGSELLDFALTDEGLHVEVSNTIFRYQRETLTERPVRGDGDYYGPSARRREEVNKHTAATARLLRKIVDPAGKLRYDLVATMVP